MKPPAPRRPRQGADAYSSQSSGSSDAQQARSHDEAHPQFGGIPTGEGAVRHRWRADMRSAQVPSEDVCGEGRDSSQIPPRLVKPSVRGVSATDPAAGRSGESSRRSGRQSDSVRSAERGRSRSGEERRLGVVRQASVNLERPVGQEQAAQLLGPGGERSDATDIQQRLRERRHAKWRLRLWHVLSVVVASAVVGGVVWLVFFSSLFALNTANVSVMGADGTAVTEEQVIASLARFSGVPITRLSLGEVESSIEENLLIREAVVQRAWPTGLNIQVNERQAAMYRSSDTGFILIDEAGVEFTTVQLLPEGIPRVSLAEGAEREKAAKDALEVWGACDDSVRPLIAEIQADGSMITLALTSGANVKWGTVKDSPLKARVLSVLLSQRGATTYDVSAPAHPVTS